MPRFVDDPNMRLNLCITSPFFRTEPERPVLPRIGMCRDLKQFRQVGRLACRKSGDCFANAYIERQIANKMRIAFAETSIVLVSEKVCFEGSLG